MYGKIMVPLDGSSFAEHALPTALGVARRTDAELELVAVADAGQGAPVPPRVGVVGAESREKDRAGAEAYLEEVRRRLESENTGSRIGIAALGSGNITSSLIRHIHEIGAGMVVMTSHGRGPLGRAWLGSIADGMVRQAPCPILLLRPDEGAPAAPAAPTGFQRILAPLDGSAEAERVLDHVPVLAAEGAAVLLLRVVPSYLPGGSPYLPHVVRDEDQHAKAREAATGYLEEKARRLRERGLRVETRTATAGQPAMAILEEAETVKADLVTMSTEGRGGVARLLLGSVADKVVRAATCPVLLLRRPRQED